MPSSILPSPIRAFHLIDDGVLVTEFDGYHVVQGNVVAGIVEALQHGAGTREAIATSVAPSLHRGDVDHVISLMVRDGFLLEVDPEWSADDVLRWSRLPWPIETLRSALDRHPIAVTTLGPPLELFLERLDAYGVCIRDEHVSLHVVIAEDLRDPRLAKLNAFMLAAGAPWILVAVQPHVAMSVLFCPGETACWHCLHQVLEANLPTPRITGRSQPIPAAEPDAAFIDTFSHRVLRWIVEKELPEMFGQVLVHRPAQPIAHHPIRRLKGCPACQKNAQAATARLETDFGEVMNDTGRRRRSTQEAFEHVQRLISPMTGVIRHLHPLPAIDERLSFVCASQHAIARPSLDAASLRVNTQAMSIGKGRTAAAARVAAMYEGIERYSGIFRESRPTFRSCWNALPGRGIHPHAILCYSDRQYAGRDAWNRATPYAMLQVPHRYEDHEPIDWVTAWSLTQNEPCYVPAALSFYDHPDVEMGFALADSNGCAAGERAGDAIHTGLLEIIERDAAAIWWFNRLCRPAVDLDSFEITWFEQFSQAHLELGRTLWILDLTIDTAVPVVVAVSAFADDYVVGFGCDWEIERAVESALMEVSQVLTVRLAQSPSEPIFDAPIPPNQARYLKPDTNARPLKKSDYLHYRRKTPPMRDLVEQLKRIGLEAIYVDQTHSDTGVPVARTIVPGAAHHWRRLGARRIYDVPVRLGFAPSPLSESDLNKVTMVL